jgi:hypothetical protein
MQLVTALGAARDTAIHRMTPLSVTAQGTVHRTPHPPMTGSVSDQEMSYLVSDGLPQVRKVFLTIEEYTGNPHDVAIIDSISSRSCHPAGKLYVDASNLLGVAGVQLAQFVDDLVDSLSQCHVLVSYLYYRPIWR